MSNSVSATAQQLQPVEQQPKTQKPDLDMIKNELVKNINTINRDNNILININTEDFILYTKYPVLQDVIDLKINILGVILNNSMNSIDMLYQLRNYILISCIDFAKTPTYKDNFISNFNYEFDSKYISAIITNECEIYDYYKSFFFDQSNYKTKNNAEKKELGKIMNKDFINSSEIETNFVKFRYIYNFLSLLKSNSIDILSHKTPNDIALILIKFALLIFNDGNMFFSDPLYTKIIAFKNALNIDNMKITLRNSISQYNAIISDLSTKFNLVTNKFKTGTHFLKPLNKIYQMVKYLLEQEEIKINNPFFTNAPYEPTLTNTALHGGFRNKLKQTVKTKIKLKGGANSAIGSHRDSVTSISNGNTFYNAHSENSTKSSTNNEEDEEDEEFYNIEPEKDENHISPNSNNSGNTKIQFTNINPYEGSSSAIALRQEFYKYRNERLNNIGKMHENIAHLRKTLNLHQSSNESFSRYSPNNNVVQKRTQLKKNLTSQIADKEAAIADYHARLSNMSQRVNQFISDTKKYKSANSKTRKTLQKPKVQNAANLVREMHHGLLRPGVATKLTLNNTQKAPFLVNLTRLRHEKHTLSHQLSKFLRKAKGHKPEEK
jgi:hypothetical protein